MNPEVEKILDYVTREEDRYYELAGKEFDRDNMLGNMLMSAQAGAFQKIRYFIEILLEQKEEQNGEEQQA